MFKSSTHRRGSTGSKADNWTIGQQAGKIPLYGGRPEWSLSRESNIGLFKFAAKQGVSFRTIRKPSHRQAYDGLYKAIEWKTGNVGYGHTTRECWWALLSGKYQGEDEFKFWVREFIGKKEKGDATPI